MNRATLIKLCLLLILSNSLANAQDELPDLVERVKPSVVSVNVYDDRGQRLGSGSGFSIAPGIIVTNWHVVEGSSSVTVITAQGQSYNIKQILPDRQGDLVLLQVDAAAARFKPLELSQRPPRAGEKVFVVGNPLGLLEGSVSEGIVAAYREFPDGGALVQITNPISPGSSGSPVLNLNGQVIGMVRGSIERGQSLNFAIPSERILALYAKTGWHRIEGNVPNPIGGVAPRQVQVAKSTASNGWTNTRVMVRAGDRVVITASGRVELNLGYTSGPDGNSTVRDVDKLIRNAPTGALIAVVGDDNDDFILIGTTQEFTARRTGALFLGINQGESEQSGSFQATIETKRASDSPAFDAVIPSRPASSDFFRITVQVRADNANNGWTNSGLVVRKGQRLRISSTGRVSLGGGHFSTPSGVPGSPDNDKLLRNEATGALIAVVGDDNDDFLLIGTRRDFVAQRDGVLFLGVNEGNLNDNTGTYDVVIEAEAGGSGPR